jgi:hypothetical protein
MERDGKRWKGRARGGMVYGVWCEYGGSMVGVWCDVSVQ